MRDTNKNRKITAPDSGPLALLGIAFAIVGAGCALEFPDYDQGGSSGTASGGAGGSTTDGAAGSTSSSPAPDGSSCNSNGECLNGHCLPSNTEEGNVCCATACEDAGAASCGTNGNCDAHGGSCALYPAGTACGDTTTCDVGMLTSMSCQMGSCENVSGPCAGGLACADATSCKSSCASSADCVNPAAECPAGECVQPVGSPCDSDEQCLSGVCGTTGNGGHCCTAACDPTGEPCGAIDCDESGACIFPETACGDTASCTNATLTSEYCDGLGECASGAEGAPCPGHLVCEDANSCYETCGSNDTTGDARCTQGFWCDGSACVPASVVPGAPCTRGAQCASGVCTALGCYL
ncbi:MAG: hypothetical protein HOW73_08105 [Polyangiaceae bacterium]|nr:hypothetical protein [Polyangiaceae bacterium]